MEDKFYTSYIYTRKPWLEKTRWFWTDLMFRGIIPIRLYTWIFRKGIIITKERLSEKEFFIKYDHKKETLND